jgi:chromosome segregation ATPase
VVNAEGEPVEPGEEGIYLRPLRDYEVLFRNYHRDAAEWTAEMAAALSDKQYAEAAAADAQKELAFRKGQIDRREAELATISGQRDVVQSHQTALERKLAEVARAAGQYLANNRSLASQIAQVQIETQKRIDDRTRRIAEKPPAQ